MGSAGQPAPVLAFEVGSEDLLVRLLQNVFSLASGEMEVMVSGVLGVFGAIEAKIIAAGPRKPPRFVGIDFTGSTEPVRALVERICAIMRRRRPSSMDRCASALRAAGRRRSTASSGLRTWSI